MNTSWAYYVIQKYDIAYIFLCQNVFAHTQVLIWCLMINTITTRSRTSSPRLCIHYCQYIQPWHNGRDKMADSSQMTH